jgi:hypothetical protein
MSGGHLNEVTQHIIMFDLEALDSRLVPIGGLQIGNQLAGMVT